ncbi:MAG: hypothetical protein ABIS06_19590 [Vicinamibacterales bacterium]
MSVVLMTGCGKIGPPLPPLHLVPAPVSGVTAQRAGNEVRLTFVLPTANANGPGPVDLAHLEIYAGTVAAGAVAPSNRDLMVAQHLAARIEVKQPAPEGKPAQATFVEELNEARLKPVFTTLPQAPAAPAAPAAAVSGTTAPVVTTQAPPAPTLPTRVYAIRGVTRSGRTGPPAGRVTMPLVDPPAPPSRLSVQATETGIVVSWTPPSAAPDAAGQGFRFNVYGADPAAAVNPAPLAAAPFERAGVEFGKEECFVVRSLVTVMAITIESQPSERVCATAADTFAPAAPKGLQAVASTGAVNLIWDANTETDLAGYLVLRGEAPGDKLQALTPAPIRDTTFRDATAQPGIRYVYAVVAVDRATPPNVSSQSNRAEETAR